MVPEADMRETVDDQPIGPVAEESVFRVGEGEILPAGRYLLEVTVPDRSLDGPTLEHGLSAMGWVRAVADQSEKREECRRIVGEIEHACGLTQGPTLYWSLIRRVDVEVFGELEYKLKPLDVEKGKEYEILFVARMKSHPTREATAKALEDMGFFMRHLSALKRDMRIPGYPGASATLWLGIGVWTGPTNYVNADDAFYFEEVRESAVQPQPQPTGREP